MPIHTYAEYTRTELGLNESEWRHLQNYIADIEVALTEEAGSEKAKDIEEPAPSMSADDKFRAGGWIGRYPGDIQVIPRKIDEGEYHQLVRDIQRWVEIIGATTIGSVFPLSTKLHVDARARIAAYSKALIEYTEILRAHRLPVEVVSTEHRGLKPIGRPDFQATLNEAAQGSHQIVSRKVEFTFESLPNYLLVRFHAELAYEMQSLAQNYAYYREAFGRQLDYHEEFLNSDIPSWLLDEALELNVADPTVIEQATREAQGDIVEVIDLWEAYQRDIGLELSFVDSFDTAVKPMSKTYELWCLGVLLEVLEDITDLAPVKGDQIVGSYDFGESVTLYYDRRIPQHSNYLGPTFDVGSGRPDFALEVNGELAWIADAKFKTWSSMDLSDYQRFFTYFVDLLPSEAPAAILYVHEEPTERQNLVQNHPISHLALRPAKIELAREKLLASLTDVINSN